MTAADAEKWIDDYRSDEDAVRIGVDPEALRAETREKIGDWNRLGRELCGRFLDAIARCPSSGALGLEPWRAVATPA